MQNNTIKYSITFFLFLFMNATFSAGIYKWTDANGDVHYGDRPNGDSAQEIKVRSGHKPDPGLKEREQKRDRLLEVFDEERREKSADRKLVLHEKAEQQQKCSDAQDKLEQYRTAGYLYKLNDKGERNILEDKEHASALEKAQDSVNHWCG